MLVFTWESFFTLHLSKLLFKPHPSLELSFPVSWKSPRECNKIGVQVFFFCVLFFTNWILKSSCFCLYFSISGDSCLQNWSHARISMCEVELFCHRFDRFMSCLMLGLLLCLHWFHIAFLTCHVSVNVARICEVDMSYQPTTLCVPKRHV